MKTRLWIEQESNTNTAIDTESDTAVETILTMCEIILTVASIRSEMEADNDESK